MIIDSFKVNISFPWEVPVKSCPFFSTLACTLCCYFESGFLSQDNNNICSQILLSEILQIVPLSLSNGISESVGGRNDRQSSAGSHMRSSLACYSHSLYAFEVSQLLLWLMHWVPQMVHIHGFSFTIIYLQTKVCMLIFSENIQNSGNYPLPPNINLFSYVKFIYKCELDMVRLCSLPLLRWAFSMCLYNW